MHIIQTVYVYVSLIAGIHRLPHFELHSGLGSFTFNTMFVVCYFFSNIVFPSKFIVVVVVDGDVALLASVDKIISITRQPTERAKRQRVYTEHTLSHSESFL